MFLKVASFFETFFDFIKKKAPIWELFYYFITFFPLII